MQKQNKKEVKHKIWVIAFVRFLPFIIFAHIYYITHFAYEGILIEDSEFLLGNSLIYAACFMFLSIKDERYHCVWNRAMWAELIFIPTFNYFDSKFNLVDDLEFMIILNYSLDIALIISLILAINHFIVPRIRNKLNN